MAKKPKDKKDPPQPEKKPEPRPITPSPKVIVKVDAAGAEKLERLPSLLGTIHARKQAATANRKSAFEDRDAIENELEELGTEERDARTADYLSKCADLREVLDKIDGLDLTIKQCVNAYDRVAGECEQGTFKFAEITVDELLAEATKKSGGQMTFDDAGGPPGVASSWRRLFAFKPELFDGHEWAKAAPHFGNIEALKVGVVPVDNLLVLADFIRDRFSSMTETSDRREILPKAPAWFRTGLDRMAAAGLRGEYDEAGSEPHEADTSSMRGRCEHAVEKDPDAWVDLWGGVDSEANKALNVTVAS